MLVGDEALAVLGRAPGYVGVARPVRRGGLADVDQMQALLAGVLARSGLGRLGRLRMVTCVASGTTSVERRAVRDACRRAGVSEVHLIESAVAAGIGLGLPLAEAAGKMVVDLGAGASEAVVIALGGVLAQRRVRLGGDDFDSALVNLLRTRYGLAVAPGVAEALKLALGTVQPDPEEAWAEVQGRDVGTGEPRSCVVSRQEVLESMRSIVASIVSVARECLSGAPAELARDLIDGGVHLVGGTSMLEGIADLVASSTSLPVSVADRPTTAAVEGAALCLQQGERFMDVLASDLSDRLGAERRWPVG